MMNKTRLYRVVFLGGLAISSTGTVSAETRAESCNTYAGIATGQYRLSKHAQCHYSGARWSDDYAGQQQWCMGVRPAITQAENTAREQLLTACYERRADVENNKYPIEVPGACRYNREQYKPVRYIFTRNAYNQPPEPAAPIPGGLITYDFNADRKHDYIFVERSPGHKFRSILCVSSPSGWQRQPLSTIKEDVSSHFSAELESLSFDQGKLRLSTGYHEHNLGSYSSTRIYSYSIQEKTLLLDASISSSSSGDGTRPGTRSVTDYVKGEIRETVDCNNMMEDFKVDCVPRDNVITRMKKADYTIAKRRFR